VHESAAIAHAAEDGGHEEAHEGTQRPYQRHVLMIDADLEQRRRHEGGLRRVRELDSHHGRRHSDQLSASFPPEIVEREINEFDLFVKRKRYAIFRS